MNPIDTFKKIDELKEIFKSARPDFQAMVNDLEKEMREQMIRSDLCQHPVIEKYTRGLIEVINGINARLLNDRDMTIDIRNQILDRRELYQGFVNVFVKSPQHLEQIIKKVEEILEANK